MAPLPVNQTGRYWVDYIANGREHSVMFRYPGDELDGAPTTAFIAAVSDFLQAMEPFMPTDWTITGARASAPGTAISLPVDEPAAVTGVVVTNPGEGPSFITFVGRTSGGRRSRLTLLGAGTSPAQEQSNYVDYRLTAAENSTFATARAQLVEIGLVGIDELPVTWYTYANMGYNAYWQRQMRG